MTMIYDRSKVNSIHNIFKIFIDSINEKVHGVNIGIYGIKPVIYNDEKIKESYSIDFHILFYVPSFEKIEKIEFIKKHFSKVLPYCISIIYDDEKLAAYDPYRDFKISLNITWDNFFKLQRNIKINYIYEKKY